ncbi:MAG: glycerol kinase GlpK [bacterium]
MDNKYILVIDEGTTGTRAVIFNRKAKIVASAYEEFTQYTPAPDRVEHDALEIWDKTVKMIKQALEKAGLEAEDIAAIGITNQRATTVVWDRHTGQPICPAIVWQDTRTAKTCAEINATEWGEKARLSTGWTVAPVYSSLMLQWIFENVPGAREKAEQGDLLFGTIDTWLIWKLTGGRTHAISYSNASVTGSLDLESLTWNQEWLNYLGVPLNIFPEPRDDSGDYGVTDGDLLGAEIPILGAIADQHAALFAQGCMEPGTVKCTHGTGTFLDMNIGPNPTVSNYGLNSIIAWRIKGKTTYGLEGYASVTGAAVQWLRDGAELIQNSKETEALALSVPSSDGVYFVPALAGLDSPFWDAFARGTIIGITRGTKRAHLVRATLEAIVYRTRDFLDAMRKDSGVDIKSVKVDGGAAANNFLLQFQADILNCEVERPLSVQATSLGAAFMAGRAAGYWQSEEELLQLREVDRVFYPQMAEEERERLYAQWLEAVKRSAGWAKV